jgi:predicted DNA-binding protein (UPF0278 family)
LKAERISKKAMSRTSIVTTRRGKWRLRSGIVDRGPEAEVAVRVEVAGVGVVAVDAGKTGAAMVGTAATEAEAAEAVVKQSSDQDSESRGGRRGFFAL